MNNSARIYAEAKKFLGTKEVAGGASNPLIAQWIKQAATWLDRDDSKTAWCGCFRGALGFATATGVPRDHFRAKEWIRWGQPVELAAAVQGDTVILKRDGGFHVALFDRRDGASMWLLGGNQSNAVTVARFPNSLLLGIRRG